MNVIHVAMSMRKVKWRFYYTAIRCSIVLTNRRIGLDLWAFVSASKTGVMPRFSGAIFGKASTKRSIRVVPVSNCGWEGQ